MFNQTIISEKLTDQDVIQRKACSNCYHSIDEHEGKCFALDFDGTAYYACQCKQLNFEFRIRLNIPSNTNGNQVSKVRRA